MFALGQSDSGSVVLKSVVLIAAVASGPVVGMVWEGLNATKVGRDMLGATNPQASAPGTSSVFGLIPAWAASAVLRLHALV